MNLTAVIEEIENNTTGDRLSIGDVVDTFADRGYGPLLLATALIIILPTGGIPGVPTIMALCIILLASQLVFGRKSPWLPRKLRKLNVEKSKFNKSADKIKSVTQKIDRVLKPRLCWFSTSIGSRLTGLACVILALMMPFLEVVPFADTVPSSGIAMMGLGLAARDGLFIIIGLIVGAVALGGGIYLLIS